MWEMPETELKDTSDARKVQKADREKLRREKLNYQFIELGNLLDPDRPKNDKASIVIDTIQVLKELMTEVNRLKAECAALSEESCELTREKIELREEKSALKSDIENLNAQYQQRVGVRFSTWGPTIDPSSVIMPSSYSFPVTLPVPVGPVPMHPFPFFTNRNSSGPISTPAPAFMSYPNQTISAYAPTLYNSSIRECGSKSSDQFRISNEKKGDDSSDVETELALKTPGSRSNQESSARGKNGKKAEGVRSSSRYTSSQGIHDSSSKSVVDNSGGV
ncbi:transcription factor bHLH121-like protein isoform X2 [Tanacetum coccineum]|uniref:Transcription factor bHLH121-like protein isoform X2 n=1 Tax=Tanacetum coccineum TaxID=301880 RepID=A0ABQ5B2G5_9ASTR